MSYRGFGPASPYRKGIEFIARTCYRYTVHGMRLAMPAPEMMRLRAMLEEMTGRSEQSIIDDILERLAKIWTEEVKLRVGQEGLDVILKQEGKPIHG